MAIATRTPVESATIEDLYKIDGKAELVHGKIRHLMATGDLPNYAASEVFVALREYVRRTGRGRAVTDNAGFVVNLPNRKSFSPDAAYYTGLPTGMRFFQGAPDFAMEVRSAEDYGVSAEREMAEKRMDYFTARTLVVWDVDLQGDDVVRVYRVNSPEIPIIYKRGEIAEAEPRRTRLENGGE